ncbi:hypothetical protein HWQ46_23895 [Shewanella sp. D64]|uniref:hypothetical protein n=1 Tax=unclassified Shewanella TaxID=196818 RepID=UPI0022BA54EF|nr:MULTISPECIES: hypothetical protein [unclassified Shewanella]MEC4728569.1 hypothetical protein [Shewanella sp. D64]MEC4740503.1 hypothetical protein [Shewanella sp. E94]WBJ94828.1 hypothetical protein HWQ47_23795 [Shewanella sp. MTB7]
MQVVDIREYEEEFVLHFGGERKKINAYTLASTLVSLADAIKEASSIINPGYEVEVLVEAFGEGSFRAKVKTAYKGLQNLFNSNRLEAIAIGIITSFIYQHTLAPDTEVKVIVNDTQVIIQQGDKQIIVPKTVYEAQKEVEKSEKFRTSISKTFEAVEKDNNITSFGFTKNIDDKTPDILIPRKYFSLLSQPIEIEEPQREIREVAELQIKRAILERTKRKWEFIWRGIKISAPVLCENFYNDFFSHKITVAPGDSLEAVLKIYQSRDEDTGIYTNSKYEVISVHKHIPRNMQTELDVDVVT